MKKITVISMFLLSILFTFQESYGLEEKAYISWEKESISSLYSNQTQKMTYLIQFKTDIKPVLEYEYSFKITTVERSKECNGAFIYSNNSIYLVCSIRIENKDTLTQAIKLEFELENIDTFEMEQSFIRYYNSLSNTYITSFDWLLDREEGDDVNAQVDVVDLDVLDTEKSLITELNDAGVITIGYINIGSIENYREDYRDFNSKALGNIYPAWEDERFLDISHYSLFQDRILERLDIAQEKGFKGIEADNMDTYDNNEETGFDISQEDMLEYIGWIEQETRKRGMFLIQKNAPELSDNLVEILDGALLEGAFYYNYAESFLNYAEQGKTVFNVEYSDNTSTEHFLERICPQSNKLGFISILKNRGLDDYILNCPVIEKDEEENYKELELQAGKLLDAFFLKVDTIVSLEGQKQILQQLQERIDVLQEKIQDPRKLFILSFVEKKIIW